MHVVILIGILLAPGQVPAGEADSWEHRRTEHRHKLVAGHALSISNPCGDIHVRSWTEREVLVIANFQKRTGEDGTAEITMEEGAGRLNVAVVFPSAEGEGPSVIRRRADITVLVPKGTGLDIRGHKGLVEGKGLESDVRAETEFGDITLLTSGTVTAKCRQGKIKVIFKNTKWSQPPVLETLHGEISVYLPPSSDVTVSAATGGFITTDYSLIVKTVPGEKRKSAQAVIGKGTANLSIESSYGDIKLLRY